MKDIGQMLLGRLGKFHSEKVAANVVIFTHAVWRMPQAGTE